MFPHPLPNTYCPLQALQHFEVFLLTSDYSHDAEAKILPSPQSLQKQRLVNATRLLTLTIFPEVIKHVNYLTRNFVSSFTQSVIYMKYTRAQRNLILHQFYPFFKKIFDFHSH